MAETRRATPVPVDPPARTQGVEVKGDQEQGKTDEWDGQGNRLAAVREGKADAELVYGGLTTVPQVEQVKTDEHTGKYVAVANIETTDKPSEDDGPKRVVIPQGEEVKDLSEEQLRPLIQSGAVRLETKDEAKDKK
jgi:hypothetical protein